MKEDNTDEDSLLEKVNHLGITWFELIKLKMADNVAGIISASFPLLIIIILSLGFIFFINLGLALLLGDLLGKPYAGFLVIAGFYLILALVLHIFLRGWLKRSAANFLIRQIFRQ